MKKVSNYAVFLLSFYACMKSLSLDCAGLGKPKDLFCVCVSGFLRDLCELILYLLLPPGDFHNKNMRYFLRVSAETN